MFQERQRNDLVLPMIVLVIAVAILSILVIWVIAGQISTTTVSQSANTADTTIDLTSTELQTYLSQSPLDYVDYPSLSVYNKEMAEFITANHQTSGLANNWVMFQESLNWADYPSMYSANHETAEFLKFNHQSTGLANNWVMFQESLNWADYAKIPPQPGEPGHPY